MKLNRFYKTITKKCNNIFKFSFSNLSQRFTNKVVIITGEGVGIGNATCL